MVTKWKTVKSFLYVFRETYFHQYKTQRIVLTIKRLKH